MFGDEETDSLEPLLKWPGGKRALVKRIAEYIPNRYRRYFEPFIGGGALFFHLQPGDALISDLNPRLTECYSIVRDDPDAVVRALRRHRNTETDYYQIRDRTAKTPHTRAAQLIYLCSLSFNGLYRENLQGRFNVPYGYKTDLQVCVPDRIYSASKALRNAQIKPIDFADATAKARRDDLVYLDPPYTVAHNSNGFVKYNASIFSWEDQIRLVAECDRLNRLGCSVIVSNANHHSLADSYKSIGFDLFVQERGSVMAAQSKYRKPISEALFTNIRRGGKP